MSEYAGRQFVGIDLHRRRTVLVRTTEGGDVLEAVRILNDVDSLNAVMARAGEDPEVVLEATYGWYWAVDALQAAGAHVHLAHPLGVKAFEYRRVKNDFRDAADLADLLRMGRLPEAWIAPPATRELRELVRHRAKLVGLRSGARPRSMRYWPSVGSRCRCRICSTCSTVSDIACGAACGGERCRGPGSRGSRRSGLRARRRGSGRCGPASPCCSSWPSQAS
jgi:hypothetical protein